MIKAVVFDMDGTLVDTEKYLVEYWEKAGKLCGYPMTREDGLFLRSLASEYAVPAMKQRLGEDFDYYKVRRCRIELMDKAGLPTECKPGAKEVLDRLYGEYKLYLVSNGLEHVQKGRLESAGICRYFEKIFLSECIGYDKPDARFFDECFKEIPDFSKEQTLIIGDSLSSDMTGGKNAGIFTVWFNPQNSENNSDVKPDMQIHSLDEIPSCFENLA